MIRNEAGSGARVAFILCSSPRRALCCAHGPTLKGLTHPKYYFVSTISG